MKGWAQTEAGGLTLVLTRRCPVRCGFCPQAFQDKDMTVQVLEGALKAFGPRFGNAGQIKLFGGEPLVRPDLVRRAVLSAGSLGLEGGVLLSTHGGLLDDAMVRFLRKHPEVEVAFGRPSKKAARLPRASLNFVLEPGQKAEKVLDRVRRAMAMGFRSFNFLPVYFVPWKASELAELRRAFAGLARLLRGLAQAGIPVEVKNLLRRGRVPLYNDGPCVDTDGSVYSSNLVLARGMEAHAGALRLGHVSEPGRLSLPPKDAVLRKALRLAFSAKALKGTEAVDAGLTEFVHDLS